MKNLLIHKLTTRFLSTAMSVTMAVGLVMGGAGVVLADTPGFAVDGTAAVASHIAPVVNEGTPVGINGTDQTIHIALPITVTDYSGTGIGWNVTLAATAFTNGTIDPIHTLSDLPTVEGAANIADAPPLTSTPATYSAPSNTNGMHAVLTTLSTTAQILANATAGTGMGRFTITPVITQVILAKDYAASYTSTFTVGFVSSPT